MIKAKLTITHESGLKARTAALFVQAASKFAARIWLEKGSKKVDGKSIMGLLSLAVSKGDEILVVVDGKDENEAMEAITRFLESDFADTDAMIG